MTSDGHEVPTYAFEETWISIQRFKRHIWCKFQIVPKWVPRNGTILPSVTRPTQTGPARGGSGGTLYLGPGLG